MLADHTPIANIATADLPRARAFYEDVLGFRPLRELPDGGVVVYAGGTGHLLLYVSAFAGTNKATSVGFELSLADFDAEIARLRSAGVTFDTFDAPGLTWVDGIAEVGGGAGKAAWFRDPDGNTIGVTAGAMG
jgi:catechol 2,3-dioxygenase-like lactoylglutathione lyase family enzyme